MSSVDLGVTPGVGLRAGGPCSGCGSWTVCVCDDDARPSEVDDEPDEPTSGLSRAEVAEVRDLASSLSREWATLARLEPSGALWGALDEAVEALQRLTRAAARAARDESRPADEAERLTRALQATLAAEHEARWSAAGVSL